MDEYDIEKALTNCVTNIRRVQRQVAQLDQKIDELKKAGAVDAALHWVAAKKPNQRDKLYLIHHQIRGERRREYVGVRKERQHAALDKVARGNECRQLVRKRGRRQGVLRRAARGLVEITQTMEAVDT